MASTRNKKASENKIGHYVLDELLVEQPASAIYLAKNSQNDERVFLVTLHPDSAKSSDFAERFQRRAETLSQINHEAILSLQDFGQDGRRPYAIMPYLSGEFLSEKLARTQKPTSETTDKTDIINSLELIKKVAAALSVSHPTGLIHHDLRPENIFLDENGQPYFLDLVVPPMPPAVSQIEETQPTELDYRSPEQMAGKALSGRSNIFSLGVLLYELLAGHKPALPTSEWDIFDQKGMTREIPLSAVRSDLTEETYSVVRDSIWQKEWSRYETVEAQISALERAMKAEMAPPPKPPPVWFMLFTRLRQPRTLKILLPAIGLVLLLLIFLMFLRGRASRQQTLPVTPGEIGLPQETDAAANPNSEEVIPEMQTNEPVPTVETSMEMTPPGEGALLLTEEANTPTAVPSPTNTAVPPTATATESTPTATIGPTNSVTSSPTNLPTEEPTETSCIPSPPFGWVRYTIQPSDSLSALGQATNTTVERLQEVNCLDTILLSIGQEIWLPFSPNPTATATQPDPTSPAATAVPPGNDPPAPTAPPATPTPPNPPNPNS